MKDLAWNDTLQSAAGSRKHIDVEKVRKAMNLQHDKRFGIHACRRTLVHRLLNNDVPEKAVQQWVGHADTRMIERYGKVMSKRLTTFVNVLEPQSTNELEPTDSKEPLRKTS